MRNFGFGRCVCFLAITSLSLISSSRAVVFFYSEAQKKVRFDSDYDYRAEEVLKNLDFSENKEVPKDFFKGKTLINCNLAGLDLRNSGIKQATNLRAVDFTDATIPLDFLKADPNSPFFKNLISAKMAKNINFDGTKMSMAALIILIMLQSELTVELEKKLKENQTHATPINPCANQPDILQKTALPHELLLKIAGSSATKDLRAFALSSKQFNQIANTPVLWKKYLEVFAPDLWKKEKTTQGVSPKELEQRRAQLNFQRATELKILQQLIKKYKMFDHPYFQQVMDRTFSSE